MTHTSSALLDEPSTGSETSETILSSDDFRAAMGCFPTGVAVLTQGCGPDTGAITVNSLTSVSLDPMLLVVCVRTGGRMTAQVSAAGNFAVSVLDESQQWISTLFSRSQRPAGKAAMSRLGAVEGVTGNAVLPSAAAAFECRLEAVYPGGDHLMFVGRVVALHHNVAGSRPLLFHRGRYVALEAR